MTEETHALIDVVSDEGRNISAGETRANNVTVTDEDQSPLLRDAGFSNDDFIINDGFVSGLPRFEDQLGPGESNLDDIEQDPTDPGPSGPALSLGINITSPVKGHVFYFPVSQQGGKITAKGQVVSESYIIQSVDVTFGDSGFLPATFTYDPSTDSYDWKCTSNKITAGADMELGIVARVTGKNGSGGVNTKTASKTVKIRLTDDIRPTVTITKPPPPANPLTPIDIKDNNGDGVFTVALEGTAADNTNELDRVEISLDGANWINLYQHPSNWSATLTLPFKTKTQTISVRAFDKKQNPSETRQLVVKTVDDKPATLQITAPEGSIVELPLADGAAGVVLPRLDGTSKDLQSGVKKVEWGVGENPQFMPANQESSNWSKWSVKNIFIPGPVGPKNIKVRCVNGAGLFTVKDLNIAVTELYPPRNPTVQEYFSNLLDFIVRRVVKNTGVSATAPLKVEDLTAALYQPFQSLLSEDKALQSQQVHQLRICIEILRKHFAKTASVTSGPVVAQATAVLQAAEAKYRQRAYETLLNRIGASFEEIRLVRLLDTKACRALAQRLGFDFSLRTVDGAAPDNPLEQFLLQPGQFTEADLETLFGLVDTGRDPLQKRDFNPKLLELQLHHLEELWVEQDDEAARPIIDPDVIGEADLYPGANLAYGLWQDRQTWVKSQLKVFRDQLKLSPPTKGPGVFDQVVGSVLGPIRDLQALESQLETGADVEARLSEMQLTLPAFVRLMKLRKLAAGGTLLDLEVDDVASILAQVKKVRSFADWRKEEQEAGLVLGPDFFRFPTDQETVVPPEVSPEWRIGAESRRLWQDTLQARIDQQKSLRQALLSVIEFTEEDSLPTLRDGLVQAMGKLSPLFDADALSRQLLIDIKTSGYQKIARVEQAIQTLQNLLIDLRTSKLSLPWSLDTSKESQEELDEELRWMGAYANWYSAMQVFLFPENLLLPTLRPKPDLPPNEHTPSVMEKETQTRAFRELIEDLRKESQLTPEKARSYAREYFDRLRSDYQAKGFSLASALTLPLSQNKPFQITEQYSKGDLSQLANRTQVLIAQTTGNANPPAVRLQNIPAYVREIFYFIPIALALHLQKSGQYLAALDWFRVVYAHDLPADKRKIYFGLKLEQDLTPNPAMLYRRNIFWLKDSLNPHEIVDNSYNDPGSPANPRGARNGAYTRFVVISLVRCLLDFADAEFACDTNESLPRARSLYMRALDLLNASELKLPNIPGLSANPVVTNLKFRAEVNLAKLRGGRNITGFKRQLEQTPSAGLSTGILPLIVGAGPFGASSARALQPTPYRYSTLIDRAKQLVTVAQQVEATYLATLEKHDIEAYNLFKASQDLGLAQANVQLQNLRVAEAADGVALAQKQQERATFQAQAFQNLLDTGMNVWERQLLNDYREAREARNWKFKLDAAVNIAEVITEAASGGFLGTGLGLGLASTAGAVAQILAQTSQAIEISNLEAQTQRHTLLASVENRKQEWTLQKGLAQKDVVISVQQGQLARDHQNIVEYELFIARIQTANAQATVEFLSRKFTNVELYEWMSGILQEVYSYFLQQAAAMARLAQNQLAFERQETTPLFIKNDYWQPPSDGGVFGGSSDPDRRGLTGSARLLQDISQLEQFAFETNKRKLQLSKTFSLARLAPLEFQRFRETGTLSFATPMQLFDQDFPGHYLRLIKRVRASVVALIPPNQGIRATLSTPGVSRVVIGGDVFQSVTVRRDPESVALTSPSNATGLFDLDAQSELLLPFEFMGVDTFWNLEMPRAANPFDYRTIADVLFTIEYTALASLDYRRQVIQRLDRTVSADRAFSFRHQFADQWYELHNPDQAATPMTVSFSITRQDFPHNIEQIATGQVALYFALADGKTLKDFRAQLRFTEQGAQTAIGGAATATPDGIISTRLGNAPSWTPMINRSPFGMWELALPDTPEVRSLFASEAISDIVFALTTSGLTPAWPL
jgi:hypothetical protein